MTSKRNRELLEKLFSEVDEKAPVPTSQSRYCMVTRVAEIARRRHWEDIEHLFDMLPIVWGLESLEFERLLGVPAGWLAAYRVHEVKPDEETWERLSQLFRLHFAMRMVVQPGGYAEWLRRRWTPDSPIGAQSPLEMILDGGDEAVPLLKQICMAQTQ
jgi:hypothetical protein